ncbi:DUF6998 domain-containing protein [Hydromonas duriensis]|uniref:DUF6998 domain-containing protein n=1 Tax=Hydromonas duriensis TaxID=1527608 RepID=A0A4R6YAZ4_9BURK|nr:hypothetical protein [Hydromonas duriensis]TDR32749.1 hypothetical protein DFR44_10245 [Hydromonas duriensis]
MRNDIHLDQLSTLELLKLQTQAIQELRKRNIVRTKNNPIGDYAEWLVAHTFKLTLVNNSTSGFDAFEFDTNGHQRKIQIKARRITSESPSRQLSAIRNLGANDFDELYALIFDEDFELLEAYAIPHHIIQEYAKHNKHTNSHILHLKGTLLRDSRIKDISASLQKEHQSA